jgi:hypothetical protein
LSQFDGKFEGGFDQTAMRLSFTEFELARNTGEHGSLDKNVYFLEAIIQVYDRDTWAADLDTFSALTS